MLDAICIGRSVPRTTIADLAMGSLLELPRRRPDFAAITADLTAQAKAVAAAAKAAASRPRSPPPAVPKPAKASPARMQPLAIESVAVPPAAAGQEAARKQEANKGAMHASFRDLRRALTSGRSFSFMRRDGASRESSVSGRCDSLPFVYFAFRVSCLSCSLLQCCFASSGSAAAATQQLQRLRRCQETQRGCAVTADPRPQQWRAVHACAGCGVGTAKRRRAQACRSILQPPASKSKHIHVPGPQEQWAAVVGGIGIVARGRETVRNEHVQMSSEQPYDPMFNKQMKKKTKNCLPAQEQRAADIRV